MSVMNIKNPETGLWEPVKCSVNVIDITGGSEATIEYSQTNDIVASFVNDVVYDPSDYGTSQIADYAGQATSYEKAKPLGVTINAPAGVLTVADRQSGIATEQQVGEGTITLYNLIPGEGGAVYSILSDGEVVQSGRLKPTGQVRMIHCATSNVRDLGGWACDGGTVKYGKLFRGGEFKTEDADIFFRQLGIRHELNLRGIEEAELYYERYLTESDIIMRDVIRSTIPEQYVWYSIADTETWREIMRCIFDCAKYNEPVFFHCSAGADRTGTVACIIEAILGMSQSDIDKDYELTCFHTGVDTDSNARRRNEGEWKGLINSINALEKGDTFRDKVINWVAQLGFTADDINTFRKAMIDGVPADITLAVDTFTVTNTLANARTSNSAAKATEGQSYSAVITAKEGYTLEGAAITVTMGGVDITASAYANGAVTIPKVSGDIVITVSAVEIPKETVGITWLNGKNCGYTVGSECAVSDGESYITTEEIPVEYGKTYTFEFVSPSASMGLRWIGIDTDDIVTEVESMTNIGEGNKSVSWTPTVAATVGLRLRTYSSAADALMAVTELIVS